MFLIGIQMVSKDRRTEPASIGIIFSRLSNRDLIVVNFTTAVYA